jgi:hypothetical protein
MSTGKYAVNIPEALYAAIYNLIFEPTIVNLRYYQYFPLPATVT